MDNKSRRDVTIKVWVAALIVGLMLYTPFNPSLPYTIAVALLTTLLIWWHVILKGILRTFSSESQQNSPSEVNTTAYKLAVLMEMMDDHERDEFKYQLKNNLLSGDDSVTIESLITEKRKRG
jgi:hypothetical protein